MYSKFALASLLCATSISANCLNEIIATGVSAEGYSSIKTKPDLAIAYLYIQGKGKNITKASSDAKSKFAELNDTLTSTKINALQVEKTEQYFGFNEGEGYSSSAEGPTAYMVYKVKVSMPNTDANINAALATILSTEAKFSLNNRMNYGNNSGGFVFTLSNTSTYKDSLLKLAASNAKNDAITKAAIYNKEISEIIYIHESCLNDGKVDCSFPGTSSWSNQREVIDIPFYSFDPNSIELKGKIVGRFSFK